MVGKVFEGHILKMTRRSTERIEETIPGSSSSRRGGMGGGGG